MRVSEQWFKDKFGEVPARSGTFTPPALRKKAPKYGSQATGKHASRREARRSQELKMLEQAGKISNLREQVKFELIPSQRGADGKVIERQVTYTADFVYTDANGNTVVEDSKGYRTQQYILRRKLMLWVHGIRVVET